MATPSPLLTIDTESTGVDPLTDRLLTIFIGVMGSDGEWVSEKHVLFNPGVTITEENAAIHGITEEKAEKEGIPPSEAKEAWAYLRSIIVNTVRDRNLPVVAYNAVFDCTLINSELRRVGLPPIPWDDLFILDPLILDKKMDKWRSGSRKLIDTAKHYGVPVDEEKAHDASYDCYMTGRIVQSERFRSREELMQFTRSQLMEKQKAWKAEQSAALQPYLRKMKGDPNYIVDPSWPERFTDLEQPAALTKGDTVEVAEEPES